VSNLEKISRLKNENKLQKLAAKVTVELLLWQNAAFSVAQNCYLFSGSLLVVGRLYQLYTNLF
jgi:hypothetical protein